MPQITLSVGQRVTLGFVVMILLVGLASGVGLLYSRSTNITINNAHNNSAQIKKIDSLQLQWASIVVLVDNILLSRQTSLIDPQLNQEIIAFNNQLTDLQGQSIGQSPASITENGEIIRDLQQLGTELTNVTGQISEYAKAGSWARAQTLRFTEMTSLQRRLNENLDLLGLNISKSIDEELIASNTRQSYARAQLISIIIFAVIVSSALAYFTTRSITIPVAQLITNIQKIMNGDFSHQEVLQRKDEFGKFSEATSLMTKLLKETYDQLEQRVADRTKALATSSDVSRGLSTILNQKELVTEVVNQVTNAFGYYHTQIYFFDKANENLVMAGGTGEAGELMLAQFHKVAKGRGLVGRAAENNQVVLVSNTSKNPEWLPNPLLSDTKSEIAIPISIGNEVLGVLDVQHNTADGLQQEDVDSLQSIANQIAIALQNVRLFTQTKQVQEQYTLALEGSNDGIWDWDLITNQVYFSPRWKAIVGYAEDELTNGFSDFEALLHPDDHDRAIAAVNDYLTGKNNAYDIEFQFHHKDGSYRWVRARGKALRDEKGAPYRMAGSHTDITESRLAQQNVTVRARQQEALNLITQKIQNTTSIEAALQIAARELGHALGMKQIQVTLEPEALERKSRENIND